MIKFRPYNVIVPKFKIEDGVVGGMKTIYKAFGSTDLQEDEYLVSVGAENATEVRNILEQITGMGLSFEEGTDESQDFAVMAKEGIWWPVPWLVTTDLGAWFIADVDAPTPKTKNL